MPTKKFKSSLSRGDYDSDVFQVSYHEKTCGEYIIHLDDVITSAKQFATAVEALHAAKEDDHIVVYLQTPGGSADATDLFVHCMRNCAAEVHVIATGGVHSAGTIILMNADSFELSEGFNALIHNGDIGIGAKFSDFRVQSKAALEAHEQLLRRTYEGFLSEEELSGLLNGRDVCLDADGFGERFQQRQVFLAKKQGLELPDED